MLSGLSLFKQLDDCMLADQGRLRSRLRGLKKISRAEQRERVEQEIIQSIAQSTQRRSQRLAQLPKPEYPEALPVSQRKQEIADAIAANQVVIVAGETGSGKTTQLPKICLELGRGVSGFIGHTQPRRLAARSVASRIAEEMKTQLGEQVGYKVRFNDKTSPDSYIKLMTDGILLNEIQQDRLLRQYDTLIIDEAHERSLNIDFILGYLKQLLSKRPDLKLIITSATIDSERFSQHFDNAPVIEVSGRTYPVEIRYRSAEEEAGERDLHERIADAVDELFGEGRGDILIFMNGEREIRDLSDFLQKRQLRHTEILPLYARLSASEQQRIFHPHGLRRIVIATNVAETSLTVPGIKYVIDPGTARISRYSYRAKVQRLPIEAISQASANQRAGRCGRVEAGICIRLYSETDFNQRSEFTDPEILRTNLASVILQMAALGLGDIESFPFVEAPDTRHIRDGIRLLQELGAIRDQQHTQISLTKQGQELSRIPLDPRLARMLLEARTKGCLTEVAVIAACLSIQDPRERPLDAQQKADQAHAQWKDPQSDFVAMLNLWQALREQQKGLSHNQFRKWCRSQYLSYLRVREWQDVFNQLRLVMHDMKAELNQEAADYASLHQAILAGMLSHIGFQDKPQEYLGARNTRFLLFPGTGLGRKRPKWVMVAELVETSRLFGRHVAQIEPAWVEPLAQHLVKRSYSEPHFAQKQQDVIAWEKQTLYGLTIVPKRAVSFGKIKLPEAREIFIRQGLVERNLQSRQAFYQHNCRQINSIEEMEAKVRRRDILLDDEQLYQLYDERLPTDIYNRIRLDSWLKKAEPAVAEALKFAPEQLMIRAGGISEQDYPREWQYGNLALKLEYHFEPGQQLDGVVVRVPLSLLNQLQPEAFMWQIPALREELVVALIKALPKQLRRNFVPAPDYARACLERMTEQDLDEHFLSAVTCRLKQIAGMPLDESIWVLDTLPSHLQIKYRLVDDKGATLELSSDLELLKQQYAAKAKAALVQNEPKQALQSATEWVFGELPQTVKRKRDGYQVQLYPALRDDKEHVVLDYFDDQAAAERCHRRGLRRLLLLSIPSPRSHLQKQLPNKAKLSMYYSPLGRVEELVNDLIDAAADRLLEKVGSVRSEAEFIAARELVRAELNDEALLIAKPLEQILLIAHAIRNKLKGKIPMQLMFAFGDIQKRLEHLIHKGFLTEYGYEKLEDILRYVQALERRLEKVVVDPSRDRKYMLIANALHSRWQALSGQRRIMREHQAQLLRIRWLLEELHVSFFAQTLGTAEPVSEKRVSQALAELEGLR